MSLVSTIRNLQRRNSRRRNPEAILESIRLCEEAVMANLPFVGALTGPGLARTQRGSNLKQNMFDRGILLEDVPDRTIQELADTDSPQGILAVVRPPEWTLHHLPSEGVVTLLLLDGVQDPGNVGTICRTARALGAGGVILLPGTARLTNPKVLRSAMGATFHFPVLSCEHDSAIEWLVGNAIPIWTGSSEGDDIRKLERGPRVAIVVGNEGAGVTEKMKQCAERAVSIPLQGTAESFNAAIASALLLYEVLR